MDSLKRDNITEAYRYLNDAFNLNEQEGFDLIILETFKEYLYVFKEKKILKDKKEFGNLSLIAETFQRCYIDDFKTGNYFSNLINFNETDYTRYIYFYLNYLVQKGILNEAKKITSDIEYINSTLLLSQGKVDRKPKFRKL